MLELTVRPAWVGKRAEMERGKWAKAGGQLSFLCRIWVQSSEKPVDSGFESDLLACFDITFN